MYDASIGSEPSHGVDVEISFPDDGIIRIESAELFADSDGLLSRRFIGRTFLAPEIDSVMISPAMTDGVTRAIELRFNATQYSQRQVLEHVAALLDGAPSRDPTLEVPSALTARDQYGVVRYQRYGRRVTGWHLVT